MVKRFVELPDNVQVSVAALVVWVAVQAFGYLVGLFPVLAIFADFVQPAALALSVYLISLVSNAVPDKFGAAAVFAIQFILALLAAFGIGEGIAALSGLHFLPLF